MHILKKSVLALVLMLVSAPMMAAFAADTRSEPDHSTALSVIRSRLENCLVRPYGLNGAGRPVYGHYRSICATVSRQDRSALIEVHGQGIWELQLLGSPYADGGDVSDIALWDEGGHLVVELQRVTAFGDPFEALIQLTNARPQMRVYDSSLDEMTSK